MLTRKDFQNRIAEDRPAVGLFVRKHLESNEILTPKGFENPDQFSIKRVNDALYILQELESNEIRIRKYYENPDRFYRDLLVVVLFVLQGLTFPLKPFWYERERLNDERQELCGFKLKLSFSDIPVKVETNKKQVEMKRSRERERAELLEKKIIEVDKRAGQALENNWINKEVKLETIGLNFNEPIPSKAWGLIAWVLVTKQQIEEVCEIRNDQFGQIDKCRLYKEFKQFARFSRELRDEIYKARSSTVG